MIAIVDVLGVAVMGGTHCQRLTERQIGILYRLIQRQTINKQLADLADISHRIGIDLHFNIRGRERCVAFKHRHAVVVLLQIE